MTTNKPYRYRAFISYSKQDGHHAKRLHSALESYRVPKGIDAPVEQDRRLGRFFRDDDEMGASTDLGATLRDALENSESLIVISSPSAARSKWVNAEIQHFRQSGRGDQIFALIVDGTPNSADPERNCFPPALSSQIVRDDLLSERHAEPLGIDLRQEPFQRVRLRLVAGLLRISFDSLWQREKRRRMRRRAIAAVATATLILVFAVLANRWLTERGRVRAQTIDRTLVTVRDDLASDRVKAALTELEKLVAEGERGEVENILTAALSWLATPAELLKEIKPPAFIIDGPQLFFLANDGSRHLLKMNQPFRRILSSDGRRLLVLTADEAVILNVADGRELARTASKGVEWRGHVFETSTGLMIVGGRFYGLTNGSLRCAFLVFSPQTQSFSVFNENPVHEGLFESVAVSPDCRNFGIARGNSAAEDDGTTMPSADMFFFAADSTGLKPSATPESVSDWKLVVMFRSLRADLTEIADGPGEFGNAGCIAPKADSASLDPQRGATALFRPIGLGAFWEPGARWKIVKTNIVSSGNGISEFGASDSPCTEERPCHVQNASSRDNDGWLTGWDSSFNSRPRGVHEDDRSFGSIDREPAYFGYTQYNGGFQAAWCRTLKAKSVCFVSLDTFELHDDSSLDLRSNTGRFIFNPRGMTGGFRLYDLSTMRDITPQGTEIIAGTKQADFSPNDERLFLTLNGRLLVFAPPSDGGAWQLARDPGPIPSFSGIKDDEVAGLIALDDRNLVVIRSSGAIAKFDWHTGQQSWGRTFANVGKVVRVVTSRNRRFLFVIGEAGGRLLDTREGLVLSGVLVPPAVMEGTANMFQCFNEAFVSDAGAIDVSCGEKEYRREPITFSGDLRLRLRELLSLDR